MKINVFVVVFAIVAVIFVSGCIDLGDIFGGNVIDLSTKTVREEPRDAIAIPSIVTLPNPPFLPDQDVTVSMIVENRDELKNAEKVTVDMFDAPTFKSSSGQLCNDNNGETTNPAADACSSCGSTSICSNGVNYVCEDDCPNSYSRVDCSYLIRNTASTTLLNPSACVPDICGPQNTCTLLPGEQKQLQFRLKAPSESEIAGIRTTTELGIKTNYDFDGSLVYIVPVVNYDEIVRLQTESKKLSLEESKLYSSGPVIVDTEILGAKYILSSSTDSNAAPQKSIINFKVKNTGGGSILNSEIEKYSGFAPSLIGNLFEPGVNSVPVGKGLVITFPSDMAVKKWPDNFECIQQGTDMVCYNKDVIQIYKDESRVSMRFELEPARLPLGTPFRSTTIKANIRYTYELRNKVSVSVNPFQNT